MTDSIKLPDDLTRARSASDKAHLIREVAARIRAFAEDNAEPLSNWRKWLESQADILTALVEHDDAFRSQPEPLTPGAIKALEMPDDGTPIPTLEEMREVLRGEPTIQAESDTRCGYCGGGNDPEVICARCDPNNKREVTDDMVNRAVGAYAEHARCYRGTPDVDVNEYDMRAALEAALND